ncbi:MAG TPA: NUDIX domain-containing protein [Candidatus Dormibacteraeota bacterium]|nr:NUDIX domain-containing protein [Candidatus Dormibacteraeota bacterium]
MFLEQPSGSHDGQHTDEFPLSDQEYGRVLDHVVVGCVDVAVVNGEEILLEKRNNDPIKENWWIFGGRILVGETLQGSAQRQLKRELGLEVVDSSRFLEIGTFNLRWPSRKEPTTTNGVHHLLIAHMIEVDDSERKSLSPKLLETGHPMRWLNISKPGELLLPEMQSILDHIQAYRSQRTSTVAVIEDSV